MLSRSYLLLLLGLVTLVVASLSSSLDLDCVNFVVVGDQGAVSKIQKAVASSLGDVAQKMNASFVVALGDNFYEFGVSDVNDAQFEEKFESAYPQKALQIPWYLVAGNHDYYGNHTAQLEYTNKSRSQRWKFPSLNYDRLLPLGPNASVHLIFFDTFHLTSRSHFSIKVDKVAGAATLSWLEETLKSSKATYKLLFTHYPFLSASARGYNDEIAEKVRPLLIKYNSTFYMAGHDHNLQHTVESDGSMLMHHYIVGSSAKLFAVFDTSKLPSASRLWFRWPESVLNPEGGFASVSVCPQQLTVKLYNDAGVEKHTYSHSSQPDPASAINSFAAQEVNDFIWIISLGVIGGLLLIAAIVLATVLIRRKLAKNRAEQDFEPLDDSPLI